MKQAGDAVVYHTNLLQAIQKNKIIQDKLEEYERLYNIQLLKDLQDYKVKAKYNQELLYTWQKENYVRKLKRDLEEHQRQRFGVIDDYYINQLRNIENFITGEQTVVIPPSEEKRRLKLNEKYQQFLQKLPVQPPSTSVRNSKSANITLVHEQTKTHEEKPRDKVVEVEPIPNLEQTWKHIHAQSARTPRTTEKHMVPTTNRSLTLSGFQRNKASAKTTNLTKTNSQLNIQSAKTSKLFNASSVEHISPRLLNQFTQNDSTLSDNMEPLIITNETLGKYTREDLVNMRSVRRPRKNASDLNLIFETRKRICEINRRTLDYESYQRKLGLYKIIQCDRVKQVDSTSNKKSVGVDNNENTEKPSNDQHISVIKE